MENPKNGRSKEGNIVLYLQLPFTWQELVVQHLGFFELKQQNQIAAYQQGIGP